MESLDLLVGFHLKFDIHWIKRYIPDVKLPRIWDCQLAEFIIGGQRPAYPSLDESCANRGLGSKLDVVSRDYWDLGIDTPDIPADILSAYLTQDLELTYKLFKAQIPLLTGTKKKLFDLQCKDLLVLEEMEFNGLKYNQQLASTKAETTRQFLATNDQILNALHPDYAVINWDSPTHVSCVLFGGSVKTSCRVTASRTLKDGTVKVYEKNGFKETKLPQLFVPNPKNKTAKEGIYSVDEDCINSLGKPVETGSNVNLGQIVHDKLLVRREQAKLLSTYYDGCERLIHDKDWKQGTLHGQFNQVVVSTGRLSSKQPNLQNFSGDVKELFYSRF